jgi:threonylcarbamoyladenosine tRNA methylthiotransferase MtaB
VGDGVGGMALGVAKGVIDGLSVAVATAALAEGGALDEAGLGEAVTGNVAAVMAAATSEPMPTTARARPARARVRMLRCLLATPIAISPSIVLRTGGTLRSILRSPDDPGPRPLSRQPPLPGRYDHDVITPPEGRGPVRRAAIANLGCKVNQAEMVAVERLLRARGVEIVDGHAPADLVVVNTCTVTAIADRKSRQAVRRSRRNNPSARVLVTGCSVVVDPAMLEAADPAALLFDNESKGRMLAEVAMLLDLPYDALLPTLSGVEQAIDEAAEPAAEPSLGRAFDLAGEGSDADEFETTAAADRTRAFVKIQDGCSFHCTYCIIPKARGPERSIGANTVLADIRRSLAAGHREVVLTGINVGTYADAGLDLTGLVRRILSETGVERIRLSSIEPQHLTPELLDVWAGSEGRCLPHFHIPLQSGDDTILRRMGRRYDTASYAALAARVRQALPGAAIHADLIVGFPGEDEAAWDRTVVFLRSLDLAGIHVFRYSARPGTPATRMVGQVDSRTKKRRAAEALALAAEARARFARRQIGLEMRVLFEQPLPDGRWVGHAGSYVLVSAVAPDAASLENTVGLVRGVSIDPAAPDRIVGLLLAVDRVPTAPAVSVPGSIPR